MDCYIKQEGMDRSFAPRLLFEFILPGVVIVFLFLTPALADLSVIDDGRYDYGLSQPTGYDVKVEYNVKIPMRDGSYLRGDIYRPDGPGKYPVIMSESPYPRYLYIPNLMPGTDDFGGADTTYLQFEQANPGYWIPRGYVYITISTRGYGGSKGETAALDYQEFEDFYDAIEWCYRGVT